MAKASKKSCAVAADRRAAARTDGGEAGERGQHAGNFPSCKSLKECERRKESGYGDSALNRKFNKAAWPPPPASRYSADRVADRNALAIARVIGRRDSPVEIDRTAEKKLASGLG